jgi:hypothetical protein
MENGINWTAHPGQGTLDGSNTRLRVGFGGCTEMLVHLPDYIGGVDGHGPSGFAIARPLGRERSAAWRRSYSDRSDRRASAPAR